MAFPHRTRRDVFNSFFFFTWLLLLSPFYSFSMHSIWCFGSVTTLITFFVFNSLCCFIRLRWLLAFTLFNYIGWDFRQKEELNKRELEKKAQNGLEGWHFRSGTQTEWVLGIGIHKEE